MKSVSRNSSAVDVDDILVISPEIQRRKFSNVCECHHDFLALGNDI